LSQTPAEPTAAPDAQAEIPAAPTSGVFVGTGRRKSAVARVRLVPGDGKILINAREVDQYFHEPQEQSAVRAPFQVTNTLGRFDVQIRTDGGGHSGQAGACLLGIARALIRADKRYEPALRSKGFLTRDSREVERKKYGQRKARRRFQFSKR